MGSFANSPNATHVERNEAGTTVTLTGGVVAEHASELLDVCRAALAAGEAPLHLDFTGVERIDGCILQILLAVWIAAAPARVHFSDVPPPMHEWVELAGASHIFEAQPECAS